MTSPYNVWFYDARLRATPTPNGVEVLKATVPMATITNTPKEFGRHWQCPIPDAQRVVEWARRVGHTIAPDVEEYARTAWSQQVSAHAMSSATTLMWDDAPPVTGLTATLLPVQEVVVAVMARTARVNIPGAARSHRALIVADEPGLGKTIESLACLRITGQETARAVIVCPTSLTVNWHAEMVAHFEAGTFEVWTATGETPTAIPDGTDTVVIGWDVLEHWVDTLMAWKPDAVVADEGHYAKAGRQRLAEETVVQRNGSGTAKRDEHGNLLLKKNIKKVSGSGRSTAALTLGAAVARNGGAVIALTGTPIVNRPEELGPLIEFVGIADLLGGDKSFKTRYCDPQDIPGTRAVDYSGASNLLELNARLSMTGHYVRRTKQVLIDAGLLKPKYVDGVFVYDRTSRPNPWRIRATPTEMAEYEAAEADVEEYLANRAREIALAAGLPLEADKVRKKVMSEALRNLQKIATLRRLAATIKSPYILAKVQEMVDKGERVVIAAHHRDIVDFYAQAFSGLKIQGDMGSKDVEHAKHLFNTSPVAEHPVLVLSVEAGKTGHTLCKQTLSGVGPSCAFMVFAEQVWTPGDETQAQDRVWRIGQEREVRIINALLEDTIDVAMYQQRARKKGVVDAAVDAVDPKIKAEGPGTLLWEMARRGLQQAP